ncbi:hypothetical protein SUGI_1062890 [Cryptomeria japonica]|uniref:thiol-disulfide oxidoreductase LTO1 n=1 Tax=Cryptomeria japonica TaxID=3369 RepID=UPI002414CEAE|nr:thiol-disulfide oxidoreductase LTO1 [Cryptomeria japonica]GLJ49975.1 hypothetical protein SUGI_1062890 [Cryptomeria japonica]
MALGCTILPPTSSSTSRFSHIFPQISAQFKINTRVNLVGVQRDINLKSVSENISCTSLCVARLPRFKNLVAYAGKPLRDGSTEAKATQLSTERPEESEAAKQLQNDMEENSGVNAWYGWGAGLALLGLIETSYLTYMKVAGNDIYCPTDGGSCGDVLNSSYASVFGLPLSLAGMAGYGITAFLALQLSKRKALFGIDEDKARWIFLGMTSSMTAASAYFMYLLTVKLEGASCAYCVTSALLSLSLLLISLRDFSFKEIQQIAGVQISTGALVIAALSTAYSSSVPALAGIDDIDLPPVEPVVTTQSSPVAISLAKHLRSVGAKLYGAFWCSHCFEQKQMFGAEAAKILDYVECYPTGYRKGVQIAKACKDANIQGFPTWVINGQVLSGEKIFAELARVSDFDQAQSES